MSKQLYSVGLGVVVVLGSWWVTQVANDRVRHPVPGRVQELRAATEELNAARQALARATELAKARSAKPDTSGGPPPQLRTEQSPIETSANAANAKTATDSEPDRLYNPTEEERGRFADSAFAAQPVDRGWATDARSQLEAAIETLPNGAVRPSAIECRTTLCRVRLAPAAEGDLRDYVYSFVRSGAWSGPGMAVHQAEHNGMVSAVIYLAVDGETVPDLQAVALAGDSRSYP